MTESHDDRTPVEHDPTGMRALLSSLPDPGPMPEDLVARITAALAHEAGTDAGATASAAVPPSAAQPTAAQPEAPEQGHGATVVPLRPRRRLQLRHLGVAAAVVGAVGLGGVVLSTGPDALTASIGAAGGAADSADSSARELEEGSGPTAQDSTAGLVPAAGSGEVLVVMSGTDYALADLATGARSLADAPGAALPSLAAEAPGIGPIGTPVGARSCADALGVPGDAGLLVDVAVVDGRPGAVLVVDTGAGRTAYAVERSCTTGTTGPVSGPVPVD